MQCCTRYCIVCNCVSRTSLSFCVWISSCRLVAWLSNVNIFISETCCSQFHILLFWHKRDSVARLRRKNLCLVPPKDLLLHTYVVYLHPVEFGNTSYPSAHMLERDGTRGLHKTPTNAPGTCELMHNQVKKIHVLQLTHTKYVMLNCTWTVSTKLV